MNTNPKPACPNRQRGLSLVESLMVLCVATVSLGAGLPAFQRAVEKRHFDGVVAQLETDLQHARSLAALQNRNLRVSFFRDDTGSCYVVHDGPADACHCSGSGAAVLGDPRVERFRAWAGLNHYWIEAPAAARDETGGGVEQRPRRRMRGSGGRPYPEQLDEVGLQLHRDARPRREPVNTAPALFGRACEIEHPVRLAQLGGICTRLTGSGSLPSAER